MDSWHQPDEARELGRRASAGVIAHYGVDRMADVVLGAYREGIGDVPRTTATASR
jgi:hypothetical protein